MCNEYARCVIVLKFQGARCRCLIPWVCMLFYSNKVAACAKHFVGDGGTRMGINENDTVISYDGLVSIHMRPYFDAVTRGVSSIMASYSSWNGVKMHANRFLLTDVLKGQLGFKGFIISDWQGIDRITSPPDANYTFSILAGIHAGIDMVRFLSSPYA